MLRGMASWAVKPHMSIKTGTIIPPPPVPVGADRAVLKKMMMSSRTSVAPKSCQRVLWAQKGWESLLELEQRLCGL